jgi:hypothetical protein
MFDLDQAIEEWRQQMLAAGIKSPVPLEELESHLRDDIEEQLRTGVSAQAAFNAAIARLGRADVLKSEFKRGRCGIRLLSPVYMRVYCFFAVPLLLSMMWAFAEAGSGFAHYIGMIVVLLLTLYIGGLPIYYRQLFTRQNRLIHTALRVGNWVAVGWPLVAILGVSGVVQFGHVVGMILWSAYAAHAANCLACANWERERGLTPVARLAGS